MINKGKDSMGVQVTYLYLFIIKEREVLKKKFKPGSLRFLKLQSTVPRCCLDEEKVKLFSHWKTIAQTSK